MTDRLLNPDKPSERTGPFVPGSADFRTNAVLLVSGSRNFTDRERFRTIIERWLREHGRPRLLIAGEEPRGVDRLAKEYAKEHGIAYQGYPADWDAVGRQGKRKSAGPRRNQTMVDACTHVLALPSNSGRGTQDTIRRAKASLRPIEVVPID